MRTLVMYIVVSKVILCILRSASVSCTLSSLVLCSLHDSDISNEGVCVLAGILQVDKSLQKLE